MDKVVALVRGDVSVVEACKKCQPVHLLLLPREDSPTSKKVSQQVRRRRRGPCTCAWRGRWCRPPCHPCPSSAPLPWGCTLPPPPRPSEIGLRSLDWDLNTPWTWEFYFNLCQCLLQQWVLADRDRGLARSQIWCLVSAGLSYRYSTHLFSKI